MDITTSPDISVLLVKATWDISGNIPSIHIENLSSGDNMAALTWWFIATTPSGNFIYEGNSTTPDISGVWTAYDINDSWPRPLQQIEWSGAPYLLTTYVKDTNGTIFSIQNTASICRPSGNAPSAKTFYGIANVFVQLKCEDARIYFEDQTSHSYKGSDGEIVSSVLKVLYPPDDTDEIPDPFSITHFSTALVPISYSSTAYQFKAFSIYDYDLGNYSHVRIRYQTVDPKNGTAYVLFPVLCNIDLCPLTCDIIKLQQQIESGNCGDLVEANQKLLLINSKFSLVVLGKMQPLCGIDIMTLINEIKAIGGFDCDCCNAATGIIPITSSIVDGYNFQIVPLGGDIHGTVTTTGFNIQFNLWDVKYIITVCPDQTTSAFTFVPTVSGDGYTKTYCLNVNMTQLSEDMANTISNDLDLLNLWSTIFATSYTPTFTVDGACIFRSTSTRNYTFTLTNIPPDTTFALLTNITEGIVPIGLSFAFNLTNLSQLQAYLNEQGLGTFEVVESASNVITITTEDNFRLFTAMNYKISSTTYLADMSSDAAGYVAVSGNEILQNIINYLCPFAPEKVTLPEENTYTVCYIDSNGDKQTEEITGTLEDLMQAMLTRNCTTLDFIGNVTSVSCASMKDLFATNSGLTVTATDFLLGTKGGGVCSRINFNDVFQFMLNNMNTATRTLFCEKVTDCGAGLPCLPYNAFTVMATIYDTTCSPIVGIEYTVS